METSKKEEILIEIEIGYTNKIQKDDLIKGAQELDTKITNAKVKLDKDKIKGSFIEKQLIKNNNSDANYIKLSFQSKQGMIKIDTILECLELINDKNYEIIYTRDNLISYLFSFTICELNDKRQEVLEKILFDINEENLVIVIQTLNTLSDEKLKFYSLYLIKSLINKIYKLPLLKYNQYNFTDILHFKNEIFPNPLTSYRFSFDENKLLYLINQNQRNKANLNFILEINNLLYKKLERFYIPNNFFNTGKILRKRSEESLILADDFPHYYEMILENDKNLNLYAIRESENSNFIISCKEDDYTKYGENYVGEVAANFWGTSFTVYDNGYNENMKNYIPYKVLNIRKNLGTISYETNIMGECPRFFSMEIITPNGTIERLRNVKPNWSVKNQCYCLNFYGRVQKASAKNFQIIRPEDEDNILLQHGKVSKSQYNFDFRDPFSPLFAFALSLVSIGNKRAVS